MREGKVFISIPHGRPRATGGLQPAHVLRNLGRDLEAPGAQGPSWQDMILGNRHGPCCGSGPGGAASVLPTAPGKRGACGSLHMIDTVPPSTEI